MGHITVSNSGNPTKLLSVHCLYSLYVRSTIAEAKQYWSIIGWVTKNLIFRVRPCFGRHAKPLVPAVFAVVSTHQSALGLCDEWQHALESIGDINRLMMMMTLCTHNHLLRT
jgi:hypothetical protein